MKNNEVSKSNKIKIIVITALIFLVSIAGISYAYFTIQITGNDTASSMRLTTANMSLVYNDVQIVSGEYAEPGWAQTKTLTVTNNGNVSAYYNIIWRDLYNEITNGELVISATCSASSGSCSAIPETIVPTETPLAHSIRVKSNIEIPVGVTHTYTLTILFKETGSNQNYNQNKEFYGTLNIEEYTPPFTLTDATYESMPIVRSATVPTEEFYIISDTSNGGINYSSLGSTFLTKINYDSSKVILLAKNVLAKSTGLQTTSTTKSDYAVPFSGSSNSYGYWDPSGSGIDSKYGTYTVYKNNIYDTEYVTAPDYNVAFSNNAGNANYSIAYYVENYINNTLGIEAEGRLLTYPEANAMSTNARSNGQYYWLGSADDYGSVRSVYGSGVAISSTFGTASIVGVRPVIVVSTSDIGA